MNNNKPYHSLRGSAWPIMRALLVLLLVNGCRKDPLVEVKGPPGPTTCTAYASAYWHSTDTVIRTYNVASSGYIYLDLGPNRHSLYLSTQTTAHWPSPSSGPLFSYSVSVRALSDDSVGVFLDPYGGQGGSFLVGDTLDPQHLLSASVKLYYTVWNGPSGMIGHDNPVWYVGFVQIRDGAKHVGYLRIGSKTSPSGRAYWFEDARIAECPGEKLVITPP